MVLPELIHCNGHGNHLLAGCSRNVRPNGKTERFIKTILAEWADVIAYQTSEERNRWLPCYLGIYNSKRCHMAFAGLTLQQFLKRLVIAE